MLGEQLMEAMRKDGVRIDTRVIPASVEKTDDGLVLHAEDGRSFGPVDCSVPRLRNHSAPLARMQTTQANVSTLFTIVGWSK